MDPAKYLLIYFLAACISQAATDKPNVIVIMTDDQGYGDLSCHGNPVIETPNLDKLHAESVRFTDFHVDPTCSPTRGALMSGKYAHRAKVWHTIMAGNHLRASEMTMADAFKASGYRTAMYGKWHIGSNYPYRPMDRGFGEWFGQGDGGTGTADDWFWNDRVNDMYWHNGERVKREGFATDLFFDEAIRFAEEDSEPFFIYLATYLPHHPHVLPDRSWAKKYKGRIKDGVAYFFASIDRIDYNMGRLRKALEESGKAENTILIFLTDNGGTAGVKVFNAGMKGKKTQVYDGGHRVPFFIHWPAGGLKHGADVADLNAHFDLLPTLIDLCDLTPPREVDFDGRSFKAQLFDPAMKLPERTLFVEKQRTFTPKKWVATVGMTSRWRLVDNKELYDIRKDPGQRKNLIADFPEVVEKIRHAHEGYWERVSPGDRDVARFVVGHESDPEVFLQSGDWHLGTVPWQHAQVARGVKTSRGKKPRPWDAGSWHIRVTTKGTYQFDVRRWPREADAPITGVPTPNKTVDSWDAEGGKPNLVYAHAGEDPFKALPVTAVRLKVGPSESAQDLPADAVRVVFDKELSPGDYEVKAELLGARGKVLSGAYYVYCTKLNAK